MLNFLKLIVIFIIASGGILYFTKKDNHLKTPHLPTIVEGKPTDLAKAEASNILIIGNGISEYITPLIQDIGTEYESIYKGG